MFVVATAGHVDHGKSTLVRALTGMEPDRWAEERRRGLTIDLGFAWTPLPSGSDVAFVDVPGHERFLGNMLAGLGPTPVVLFVVAADEGWRAQSADHRDAIAALGIDHGLIVITRADRGPDEVELVIAQARRELAGTGLADATAVVTSALTGAGMDDLRRELDTLLMSLPPANTVGRVRFWVDRSFSIAGSGTVVTGTLSGGTISRGDSLELRGQDLETSVGVRGLQQHGRSLAVATATSRVAINLRGVPADTVRRGDVLLSPGAWPSTATVDVTSVSGEGLDSTPERLLAHMGTAAVPVRVRPFSASHARLQLTRALPLCHGDRIVLRDPGTHRIVGGVVVVDADPPSLQRRGDAARRSEHLAEIGVEPDVAGEVRRRGAVRRARLMQLGVLADSPTVPKEVVAVGDWWIHAESLAEWGTLLTAAAQADAHADALSPGLTTGAALDLLELPDRSLLRTVVEKTGLVLAGGHVHVAQDRVDLGHAEASLIDLEQRLAHRPFDAPEADELTELGLGARELAAAERVGRLLRLADGIVVRPDAPALAMRTLAALPQPFTTSQARQALGMTRRTVIPLLEHLDKRGWTRRVDSSHRQVVRPS